MVTDAISLRLIALRGCEVVDRDIVRIGPSHYRVVGWQTECRSLKLELVPDYDEASPSD